MKYGPHVVAATQRAFETLVPACEGADLYTHLFRSVYGRIACHYYARPETSDLKYMATIYGHYWIVNAEGKKQQNYASTEHYMDYVIGDGHGNIDGRQGIKLSEPGVVVLEVFKPKPVVPTQKKEEKEVSLLPTVEKKGHSALRPDLPLRARIDDVHAELGTRTINDALSVMVDEHYILRQMVALLEPMYEQLGAASPTEALQALLAGASVSANQRLQENWQTSMTEVEDLLLDAKADNDQPVAYLKKLLTDKRTFKQSYEKRHQGKDYSKMSLTVLRNTKTTEAAQERFRRAVAAIMEYNDSVPEPEMRWYVSPAVVVDLVGGRPSDVKEYLLSRKDELDAHHNKFDPKITPGYNRRPMSITKRIQMQDVPAGVSEPEETESSEVATEV